METPKNLLQDDKSKNKKDSLKLDEQKNIGITSKLIISFLIGSLVGAIGFWVSSDKDDSKKENSQEKKVVVENKEEKLQDAVLVVPKTRKEPVSVSGSNAIYAESQISGDRAIVKMVTLSVPGWVAIHEDRNGLLGNILGAQRYEPGVYVGEVELLRPMISGSKYRAVLYQDLGDRSFNSSEDAPIKDADGKIIEAVFEVR